MCWYMRGLSYSEGMHLGQEEREIVAEIIKENLETTKKTQLPFFQAASNFFAASICSGFNFLISAARAFISTGATAPPGTAVFCP